MHHTFLSLRIILGALLSFMLSATLALAQSGSGSEIHISADGELYFLHQYPRLKAHKAFVVSPTGGWEYYYSMRSGDAAAKAALAGCAKRLAKDKKPRRLKCTLFDVDGRRTGKAAPIGISFGTAADGPDRPWQLGKQWHATGTTKRGTMLLVHGCSGFDIKTGWQMAWVNYYRAAGFRVVLPDSFAEPRDPIFCGSANENTANRQTRIVKLRVAQTLRTLASLRTHYPGEPIYLHGHSEGGWVVQALGEKVDGIIVTGTDCGFGESRFYWVAKGVPVLVIAGTKDPFFPEATSAKALTRLCRNVRGAGKMTWVSVTGMDHYAAIWWPEVEAAISRFLKISSVKITRSANEGVAYPNVPSTDAQAYQQGRQHKAIAAHKNGSWAWNIEAGSRLDTEENALFDCDLSAGEDVYLDSSHMHGCVLVDVSGKRLVK